jgi:hypothetical protein
MLYTLSYEGLRCAFAVGAGRVFVCWVRAGCLVPDGLCRICAACRAVGFGLPPRRAGPIVRLVGSGYFRRDGVGQGEL